MSEVRQAVGTLAGYVASGSMDVPDAVFRAAPVYAAACRAVNERLADCDRLVLLNQRSEAVRQARLEPDVLAGYAELDFKGRQEWQEVAVRIGAAAPPPLDAALARRVHKAFEFEEEHRELLAQHRRAAVARAPVARRLDILRLLARADPTNFGWKDDLRRLETARYDEVRAALAGPGRDWKVAGALLDELKAPDWAETKPPFDLLAAAEKTLREERERHGRKVLQEVLADLRGAVAAADLGKAEGLADEAHTLVGEFDLRGRPLDPVAGELQWVEDARADAKVRRKFDAAVTDLRQALDDGLDWVYVQDYYRAALRFSRPLPRDVADRFAAVARRRFWVRAAAAAGGIGVLLAAAAAYAVYALAG